MFVPPFSFFVNITPIPISSKSGAKGQCSTVLASPFNNSFSFCLSSSFAALTAMLSFYVLDNSDFDFFGLDSPALLFIVFSFSSGFFDSSSFESGLYVRF